MLKLIILHLIHLLPLLKESIHASATVSNNNKRVQIIDSSIPEMQEESLSNSDL